MFSLCLFFADSVLFMFCICTDPSYLSAMTLNACTYVVAIFEGIIKKKKNYYFER